MMNEPSPLAHACGRLSLALACVNVGLIIFLASWWVISGWAVARGGDPPGPQFAFAALVVPALFVGGALFLGVALVGAILALVGWLAARRSSSHSYATSNAIALPLHLTPPIIFVIGRQVWLSWSG